MNPFKYVGGGFVNILKIFFRRDFLFGAGLGIGMRILRWYGLFAFLATLITAITLGIRYDGTFLWKLYQVFFEIARTIVGTDQYIYELSRNFHSISNPTLWQTLVVTFQVLTKCFYYFWWFRLIKSTIIKFGLFHVDLSTVPSKVYFLSFRTFYILIVASNIAFMLLTKQITFSFGEWSGVMFILNNIFHIFNVIFSNWWHFFVAFKGIGHFLIFNIATVINIIFKQDLPEIHTNITNMTNSS